MFALAKTDTLEGIASVADVVDFNCTAIDGNTLGSSEGSLGVGQTIIWTALQVTQIISLVLVNTHSSAVTINIQKDPGNAGSLYYLIPEDLSLGAGESLIFTGDNIVISDGSSSVSVIGPLTDTELRASAVPMILYGADGKEYKKDLATGAFVMTTYSHHDIHAGSHYYIQGYLELDDTDEYYIKMVTPDTTKWGHFIFDIKSTGICTSTLDEIATGGMTGGSSVIPINNNRNSVNTSGLVFTSGVTACTGYTTRLENDKWGADGFKENIGGGSAREDELVLKQDTIYCRSFISGADSNIIQFKASWYEHTSITL